MPNLDGKELKQVIDPDLAKAFTHPLRSHVWVTLFERGEVSPVEVANELGLKSFDLDYHFQVLKRRKLTRLTRTAKRRGAVEHFYEPIAPALDFDDVEWMKLPEGVRSSFSGEMVRQIVEQLTDALAAGCFDTRNRHLSRTWLFVDERGWKELMRAVQVALDRILAIQERCAERRSGSSEPRIPVSLVMASFETADSVSRRKAGKTDAVS
jgi:hypothetical protein